MHEKLVSDRRSPRLNPSINNIYTPTQNTPHAKRIISPSKSVKDCEEIEEIVIQSESEDKYNETLLQENNYTQDTPCFNTYENITFIEYKYKEYCDLRDSFSDEDEADSCTFDDEFLSAYISDNENENEMRGNGYESNYEKIHAKIHENKHYLLNKFG